MPWTFYLYVTNGTDRDLVVKGSQLNWGYWYRDNSDNRGPIQIPKGQTVQALGLRAARGTATGYECSCTWGDATPPGEKSWGAVNLYIDVPYVKSNSSRCSPSGALFVHDWHGLPGSGHNFNRSITITTQGTMMAFMASAQSDFSVRSRNLMASMVEAPEDEDDSKYREYLLNMKNKIPDVKDWDAIRTMVPVFDSPPNAIDCIPQELQIPFQNVLIGRSEPDDIPKNLWPGVGDPDYPNYYAKDLFVKNYFSAALYSVNTDPRAVISIARGQTRTFKDRVEITSFIRHVHETTWSIKTSLETKTEDVFFMKEIAAKIESEYGVRDVLEESTTQVKEHIEEQTFTAPPDNDIAIVPWVFSTIVLIYRVDNNDKAQLVAVSEWAQWQLTKTYNIP